VAGRLAGDRCHGPAEAHADHPDFNRGLLLFCHGGRPRGRNYSKKPATHRDIGNWRNRSKPASTRISLILRWASTPRIRRLASAAALSRHGSGGQRELVLQRLIENIHQHRDHMTTGFVGVMPMLLSLPDWGYEDLGYTVAMQEDVPGFLQMIADGWSTMGESLDNISGSRHHPFGACIGTFLFREIAGVRTDPTGPGFAKVIIRPVLGNLAWAKARYDSIRGPLDSDWQRQANRFTLRVSIPVNTTATV